MTEALKPAASVGRPRYLKLERALTSLIIGHPFFSSILLRHELIPKPGLGTMATDGKYIFFDPKVVDDTTGWSHDELVGVLAHEALHIANLHPWRMGQRKIKPWNIACDKVVNHFVTQAKLALPKGTIPPVPDKSAEELYRDDPGEDGDDGQNGDGGDGDGNGYGVGGVMEPRHADGSKLSEAEMADAEGQAKVIVQQALNAAKAAGNLPAGLERMIDEVLEPRVPWREILSRFIDRIARNDFSWLSPNRRHLQRGFVLPSLRSLTFGNIIMANDTSGSINFDMLKEILSETIGFMELYADRGEVVNLRVLWCDTQVHEQVVSDAEELVPKGGGGTDFAPVFEHVKGLDEQPVGLVYVTDGYCSSFGEAPEYPVLWILTERNPQFQPPFGEVAFTMNT